MPTFANRRFYKFHMPDGRWKIIKARDKAELVKEARKHLPMEIYYSTSIFNHIDLNKIEHKQYQQADRHFISQDLVFDIDNNNYNTACLDTMVLIEFMDSYKEYKLSEIHYTANRGNRLIYETLGKKKGKLPKDREFLTQLKRKALTAKLEGVIASLDSNITWDTSRVIRLVDSLHRKTKFRCKLLSIKDLGSPASILKNAMTDRSSYWTDSGHSTQYKDSAGTGLTAYLTYNFISNKIRGTKDRYIPFFMFHKNKYSKKALLKLQRSYNLSTFYEFTTKNNIIAFSLDAIPIERLRKIYTSLKCVNSRTFFKFGHSWIRVSEIWGEKEEVLEERPQLTNIFGQESTNLHSRPHLHYLKAIGLEPKHNELCGAEYNNLGVRREWYGNRTSILEKIYC